MANFRVSRVTIDPVTWTTITVPVDCNGLSVENSVDVDMTLRTTSGDASTERLIPAGTVHNIPPEAGQRHSFRFRAGTTAYYLLAASGTGPAVVEYL